VILDEANKNGRVLARQLCLFDDLGLTDAEMAFGDAYILTRSPADAYIAANGPSTKRPTARKMGAEWLRKNDRLRAYIEQRRTELALEAGLTQEEVIAYLRTVVLIGLGRVKIRKSLTDKSGAPIRDAEVYEPSLSAANSAAMGLAKFLGIDEAGAQQISWAMNLGALPAAPAESDRGDG
jgi:hypothetical protein